MAPELLRASELKCPKCGSKGDIRPGDKQCIQCDIDEFMSDGEYEKFYGKKRVK